MKTHIVRIAGSIALVAGFAALPQAVFAQAWEPTKTVEFVVPAGTGGGADQMARAIQGIIAKHNLMKQSMVVVNKAGGAGSEGFLDVKNAKGDPHKIIITLSNLFTTPLATGIPFSYKDITPVASGVVNRLLSVMTILCGFPLSPFTSRKPSAPAPPDLLTTMIGCAISLFFATTP